MVHVSDRIYCRCGSTRVTPSSGGTWTMIVTCPICADVLRVAIDEPTVSIMRTSRVAQGMD